MFNLSRFQEEEDEKPQKKRTRSARSYKTRLNPNATPKQPTVPKGKGRRGLFKKVPMKAPTSCATTVTSEHVFHKASQFELALDLKAIENIFHFIGELHSNWRHSLSER